MDFTLYWFMFPVAMCVATTAMLSGIGGAALFTPIFLIIFPILGPEYPLESAVAAVGSALLTETFGFSSGFVGYYRKGLIDFKSAVPFIIVGVPIGIIGALLAQFVNPDIIKTGYALMMLFIAYEMFTHRKPAAVSPAAGEISADTENDRPMREIRARDGTLYTYRTPKQGLGAIATSIGAFLTGLLSVGIGEVVMPQLAKRNGVPIPVAAATSVLVVIIVVAAASFTHISALIAGGGMSAVPWDLVMYTIPAVIIGGQIGPRLQGKIPQRTMEICIGVLFFVIAVSMAWIVLRTYI